VVDFGGAVGLVASELTLSRERVRRVIGRLPAYLTVQPTRQGVRGSSASDNRELRRTPMLEFSQNDAKNDCGKEQ